MDLYWFKKRKNDLQYINKNQVSCHPIYVFKNSHLYVHIAVIKKKSDGKLPTFSLWGKGVGLR